MRNDVLEYIGLNLENPPRELDTKNEVHMQSYSGSNLYKVYDYISVHNLEVLITPLDRTAELKERYREAKTLEEYLKTDNQKLKKTFMEILDLASVNEIKKIEELQEKLNKKIPDLVRYSENYLWQIYYSEQDNKYFMLFPANEGETSVLFYIIKKKLEKADTKIFVPINKLDYSGVILSKQEINDMENYIWLFTNEWPNIYEVCNKEIYITGKTKIIDVFYSFYRNVYDSKEKAKGFYMLLKAMFILSTETNYQYTLKPYVNEKGELELKYNGEIVNTSNLTEFIDKQTELKKENIKKLNTEIEKNKKILEELKEYVKEQNNIYVMQEKQIAMFLECKNSFFKKISYFFKSKKFTIPKTKIDIKIDKISKEEDSKIDVINSYTIKELINVSLELNKIERKAKDLRADIRELQIKKENLSRKIKNASEYIAEIEKHKKSIFEFWKFTNKDAIPALEEGNINGDNANKNKILGVFNLEQDLDILGTKVDSLQRQKLTQNEMNVIFASQFCIDAINNINDDKILEKNLNKLKAKAEKVKEERKIEDLLKDYKNIKTIKSREHRETERNEISILNINKSTTIEQFREILKRCKKTLNEALEKITSITQMPIYVEYSNCNSVSCDCNENCSNDLKKDSEEKERFIIGEINPVKLINSKNTNENEGENNNENKNKNINININKTHNKIQLKKLQIKDNTHILYFSNIIFFENQNNTLPIGMDLSTKVLIKIAENSSSKKKDIKIEDKEKEIIEEINLLEKMNDFEYKIKTILIQ